MSFSSEILYIDQRYIYVKPSTPCEIATRISKIFAVGQIITYEDESFKMSYAL